MPSLLFRSILASGLSIAASLALCTLASADPVAEIKDLAPRASATLQAYHGHLPGNLNRRLHIVYWTPSDREPQPQWRERLSRVMQTAADFYEKEMQHLGLPARRIPLDLMADGLINIHLVKGTQPHAQYDRKSGADIRKECLPSLRQAGVIKSLDGSEETIVIFCNMSTWDPAKRDMRQNSPYYAGGTAKGGTAWQVDSPLLDPLLLNDVNPTHRLHDGEYGNITLGKYNSIFVGGVIHEVGHALGLPHNRERAAEAALFGTALMGSGNRTFGEELRGESKGSFLTLAHGLRLASHPLFSGSHQGLATPTKAEWKIDQFAPSADGRSITISGKVTSDVPIYALVAYNDPAGNSDYNAFSYSAIPQPDGSFQFTINDAPYEKPGMVNLVACHTNGLTTHHRGLAYDLTPEHTLDLSGIQLRLELESLFAAREQNQTIPPPANPSPVHQQALTIAQRIWSPATTPTTSPADIATNIHHISLCDTKPDLMKVGWGKPHVDRLPAPHHWLNASGRPYERGYYAHAPALHQFQLGKAWKTLEVTGALATSSYGKVVFVIKGDGKELTRTPLTDADTLRPLKLDISTIDNLELIVEDGGDGTNSDWGLWLNPSLTR